MSDKIIHKRNLTPGAVPTTASLDPGEIAINVADGLIFTKQSGSGGEQINTVVMLDTDMQGSITASAFSGDGSGLSGVITELPAGLVSSSAQIDFPETSSYALTASLATSINFIPLTASYALTAGTTGGGLVGDGVTDVIAKFSTTNSLTTSSITDDSTSVEISVPVTASAFSGDGSGITGVISASYAVTAAYAENASGGDWDDITNKPSGLVSSSAQVDYNAIQNQPTTIPTASYAVTAAYAENAASGDWDDVTNKPSGLVSSSVQVDYNSIQNQPTTIPTASYVQATNIDGTVEASQTASYVDWDNVDNVPSGLVSSSLQVDYNNLQNLPTTIATASYVDADNIDGVVLSSSHAETASLATSINFIPLTASYALTAGTTGGGLVGDGEQNYVSKFNNTNELVTSSIFDNGSSVEISTPLTASSFSGNGVGITGVLTASYAVTAAYAENAAGSDWSDITNIPVAIVSSSTQIDLASATGTAASATSASHAADVPWAGVYNKPVGLVSSSAQVDYNSIQNQPTTIATASYVAADDIEGIVASSSYAQTASLATSINFIPLTASYALTAGTTGGGLVGDGTANVVAKFSTTNSLTTSSITDDAISVEISVPVTASAFSGDGAGITGILTASHALTAETLLGSVVSSSYAETASFIEGNIAFPAGLIVTGNIQLSGGTLLGSASYAVTAAYAMNGGGVPEWDAVLNKPTGLVSSSAQVNLASASGTAATATSASHATTAPWDGVYGTPSGLVSSSVQVSYTGITGVPGGIVSSSAQVDYDSIQNQPTTIPTASYVQGSNIDGAVSEASTAPWAGVTSKPTGLVSSSAQVNLASATGTAAAATSASHAATAPWGGVYSKPVGLVSSSAQVNLGSAAGTAATATSASHAATSPWSGVYSKPVGLVSSSAQVDYNSIQNQPTTIPTASYIATASYALTAETLLGSIESASYAATASYISGGIDFPDGLIVTGNIEILNGTLLGSASYAATASYISGGIDFPDGLVVTGSIESTTGFIGDGAGITGIKSTLAVIIFSSGSLITTGFKGSVVIPQDSTAETVQIMANQTGSISIDLRTSSWAAWAPDANNGTSITGSTPPSMSAAVKYQDTTLTGWDTTLTEGEVLSVWVRAVSGSNSFNTVTVALTLNKN